MNKCKVCGIEYEIYETYWRNEFTKAIFSVLESDICQTCHRTKVGSDNYTPERAV